MAAKKTITVISACSTEYFERVNRLVDEEAAKIPFLNPKKKVSIITKDKHGNPISRYGYTDGFSVLLNRWYMFQLADEIDTDFALIVQLDGRILNPNAWTDRFFDYDYIGPCGGFSMRSKKLLEKCKSLGYSSGREDRFICVTSRKRLEDDGIEFAPNDIENRWGVQDKTYTGSFGAHGSIFFKCRRCDLKKFSEPQLKSLYDTIQKSNFSYRRETSHAPSARSQVEAVKTTRYSITIISPCSKSNLRNTQKLLDWEAEKLSFLSPSTKASVIFDDSKKNATGPRYTSTLNEWYLFDMWNDFETDFALVVHHDGIVLNPSAWTDDFLRYDYIGSPWSDKVVGNGGFSIRSKRLMQYVAENFRKEYLKQKAGISRNEDHFICRTVRNHLESNGFTFAPYDLANKFGTEGGKYEGQFGAHHNLRFEGELTNLKKTDLEEKRKLFSKTSKK